MHLFKVFFTLLLFNLFSITHADDQFIQRKEVKQFIQTMVQQHNFHKKELVGIMSDVRLQPQVIDSMNKPFEKKTWDIYKQLFLTPQRVQEGILFWQANREHLAKAEQHYGVDAHLIVAVLGIETLYGKRQGNYRVIDALSTLAFNYPKRSVFFMNELKEYLLLCREQNVSPDYYLGSYAGAIGKPQFMPSSYRNYAANFTGQTKKDLINDNEAVIASIANYFHKHGWQKNQRVAQPAIVKGDNYKKINSSNKKALYQMHQLLTAGIKPSTLLENQPLHVGFIELATQTGSEFWLAYPNFYVITRYNTSPLYAMAVYLLSQQLKEKWLTSNSSKTSNYA